MYEFIEKYENKINFDEEEYERNDLIQVWSKENNPLTEEELNKYIESPGYIHYNECNRFLFHKVGETL